MSSFSDILALRGRVIVFTPSAPVGLRFEQFAERHHATVVCTRGWADIYGPLLQWTRIHHAREYGVLSCDQTTYFNGVQLPATDYVWVGNCFDTPTQVMRHQKAAQMALDHEARLWTIAETAL